MLNKCKDYYRGNKHEIELIEQFRNGYTSKKAIDWYTRESFIYRLINRAFRTEDITLWYLFRYFIIDLCIQLESVHQEQNIRSSLTVYCGQTHMSTNEFENIKSNIGCLLSTNGFLSTSKKIQLAEQFIGSVEECEDFKAVLFEITVDGSSTIFVDIDQYKTTSNEEEVLFNIGSVFKVENIDYDCNRKIWIIKMKATDEGTHEIKARIDDGRKRQYYHENINLMFGRLLLDTNEYIKAESYFRIILQLLPKSHEDSALIYDHIGDLNMRTSNWNEALKNFNLAYEIKKKILSVNHPLLAFMYISDTNNIISYLVSRGMEE
jgi:tetratricopeptide (TPR) repeat protein